jgi:hypothetical protein
MKEFLEIQNDIDLNKAFEIITSMNHYKGATNEIAKMICNAKLTPQELNQILSKYKVRTITDIKDELLDIVLNYINIILNDNYLTQKELNNVRLLKLFFKIKERDFYKYRYDEIKEILHKQLSLIYRNDNRIDEAEALYKVDLQELFSLSYDQFLEFANEEDIIAIEKGANVTDLDTILPTSYFRTSNYTKRLIPQEVKDLVWKRDNGKCVICGSNEKLEFDHIIPIAKGGSNTYRNIQLLCETCNRKKSDNL